MLRSIIRAAARLSSPTFTAGSLVYIESRDGRVLFVKSRFSSKWSLPGGFHRRGESAEDTAVREVFEETGLTISQLIKEVGQCRQNYQAHYDHIFLVDFDRNHTDLRTKTSNWRGKIEISKSEWRTMDSYETPTQVTGITPEAAHALDLIRKIPGREL